MKRSSLLFVSICVTIISLFSFQAKAQYCTPGFLIGCSFPFPPIPLDDINTFTVTGEAGTSISNVGTGCVGTGAYDDRHLTETVTMYQGVSYLASINSDASADNVEVFIDFNDNFAFASSESVGGSNGIAATPSLSSVSIAIPATATLGTHRMRVIVGADATYPGFDPCATLLYGSGEVHDYTVVISSATPPCPPVTGLSVTGIGSTSATLSWTAATGALGYEWAVTTSATPPASGTFVAAPTTTANPTGLVPTTIYYGHVRTKCSATSFSTWVTQTFTTTAAPAVCPPVTGLTYSSVTATSALLSWTAATGAAGYEWAVTTSATPPASGTAIPATPTSVTASGLTPATVYYGHVRTQCSSTSYSTWVSTGTFTTSPASSGSCAAVSGVSMSSITASSAILNWAAVTGATGYEWIVNTTPGDPTGSGTATTLTTATATGLSSSITYYAHVRTNCGGTFSAWTNQSFSTLSSSCPPVTGLAVSAITTTSATVSWTAVAGSTGYQYKIDNIATAPTGPGTATTATSTSPTGLTPGTTYYAHVRNNCGGGTFSAWVTVPFTTLVGPGGCNAPTGLTASGITATSATISWTMATGAVGAQWLVDNNASDPVGSGTNTTLSSVLASGLTGSTTYYAHVRDTCGLTSLSAWVTIPLTTLDVHDVVANSFNINAYPNPVSDILTVAINGQISGNALVMFTDIAGKVLKVTPMHMKSIEIDMTSLPSGIYLVRYIDAVHTQTIKVSKQ